MSPSKAAKKAAELFQWGPGRDGDNGIVAVETSSGVQLGWSYIRYEYGQRIRTFDVMGEGKTAEEALASLTDGLSYEEEVVWPEYEPLLDEPWKWLADHYRIQGSAWEIKNGKLVHSKEMAVPAKQVAMACARG